MTTTPDQISIVLSGGSTNINPNNSIGGDPSSAPIVDGVLNNLFADVSSDNSLTGRTDYRCVYVFNDGDTPVYNVQLWISNDFQDGSILQIGCEYRDESQRITITGAVTGGSAIFSYLGKPFTSNYNSDLGLWATSLQTAILDLVDDDDNNFFSDLTVVAQTGPSNTIIFDVLFFGDDGKKNFDKFVLVSNSLTPSVTIAVSTPQEGAPVNTVAVDLNTETTPPGGVTFLDAGTASRIALPKLLPADGLPIWFQRTTDAGAAAKERDGFTLSFSAESLRSA
jgi:hypothetical protein